MSEWRNYTLKDIVDIEYGKSPKDVKIEYSGIPIFGTSGQVGYASKTLFEGPLIMIGRKGTINKPLLIKGDCWIIDTAYAAKPKLNVDIQWLHYCLINSKLEKLNEATGVPSLNRENLYNLKLKVPPLKEQQKIASILFSVDEAIEKTESIIEQTEKFKKGLMQQLFTKGIGHTKFKKTEVGEIPEEWDIKTLEEVSHGKGEYGIGASATEYLEGEPRYLRITDIDERGRLSFSDIRGLDEKSYERYLLGEGDIVFARTGNTTGKSYLYRKEDGNLVFAGFLIRFTLNKNLVYPLYIANIVQTKFYWNWVKVMSKRSGQPGINGNEYSAFKIPIPSLSEQIKIASTLSGFDEKVENELKFLQKLNELKKGLMQSLLTGKVRIKVDEAEVTQA